MSVFSGPANRRTDRQLFGRQRLGVAKLQQQSRKELRQKAREVWWQSKTAAERAAAQARSV